MKKTFTILFTFMALIAVSCGGNHEHQNEEVSTDGEEYTSAYICPMHCEGSGGDEMGKCPVCKMDYVKNEKSQSHEEADETHGHDTMTVEEGQQSEEEHSEEHSEETKTEE